MLISYRCRTSLETNLIMFAELSSALPAATPRLAWAAATNTNAATTAPELLRTQRSVYRAMEKSTRPWSFCCHLFPRAARAVLALSALAGALLGCSTKKTSGLTDAGTDASADGGSRDAGSSSPIPPPAFTAFVDAGVDNAALPLATGDELLQRMRHLLDAAAQNNADLARDVVFPREAFLEVKDTKDPGKAWDTKVLAPFRRSMSHMAARTKGMDKAKFVEFELGTTVVRSKARKHEYKCDLWHVKRSRIVFTIDGKVHRLDIAEMTSFRGAWYVSRL
jgi:hypothetical protein